MIQQELAGGGGGGGPSASSNASVSDHITGVKFFEEGKSRIIVGFAGWW